MKTFLALVFLTGLSCVGCGADDAALVMKDAGEAIWSGRAPEDYRNYENTEVDRARIGGPDAPQGDREFYPTGSSEVAWDQSQPGGDAAVLDGSERAPRALQGVQTREDSGLRDSTDAVPSDLASEREGFTDQADEMLSEVWADVGVQTARLSGASAEAGASSAREGSAFEIDDAQFDEVYESGEMVFAVYFGSNDAGSDAEYFDDVASLEEMCEAELKNSKPGHSVSHAVVHTDEIHMVCHKVDHNKKNSFTHEWKKVRVR